ncbi:MAG TPA: glycosyltransferase family 39 protein [Myxococcota bacterium]|nr:glycosyltransferase family 39 protein [Myxococcota bacterium]
MLLLVYVGLAIAYQRAVPLFEAPDEPSHIQYVAFVNREGRLPHMVGKLDVPGEGMEPPLYYLLQQPLFSAISSYDPMLVEDLDQANRWIYRLADLRVVTDARIRMIGTTQGPGRVLAVDPALDYLRALRWGSLAFGAVTVLLTFEAARRISGSLPFACLGTSLLAFSPQFLFVSSYVNNDVACAALGAATLLLFAVAATRDQVARRDYLWAAALMATALATKLSALPAVTVAGVALFAVDRRPLRERLRDAGFAAALGVVLALPSLWMNWHRFGGALGTSALVQSSDSLEDFEKFGGRRAYFLGVYPFVVFRSYWATFGWLNVLAPDWMYLVFFALCGLGLLGFAIGWRTEREVGHLRYFVLATLLATFAAHLWLNLHIVAVQGRHLFGAAPAVALLLALGIGTLFDGRGFAVGWRTAGVISAGMLGIAAYCLGRLLLPVYG